MPEKDDLSRISLEKNPEPRVPLILLLDTSGSMKGDAIAELNAGLCRLQEALAEDEVARLRVEVMILSFGGEVETRDVWDGTDRSLPMDALNNFVSAARFTPPTLEAEGKTPMGQAARQALELIRERKEIYKREDLDYYRPWMFLITDGEPTDDWKPGASAVREEEEKKGILCFPIGVSNANMEKLAQFSTRDPKKLHGIEFRALFEWVSNSMKAVSRSAPGEMAPLPSTKEWEDDSWEHVRV